MATVRQPPVLAPASLVDLDPQFAERLDRASYAAVRRHAMVQAMRLSPGTWDLEELRAAAGEPFAALVAEGLIVSEVVIGDAVASELLGPGDVVDLGRDGRALLPAIQRWSVAEPVTVGLLDAHLVPVLRAWPALGAALTGRAVGRGRRLEIQRAISQLPRVEDRLLALFGHLGERFGRIGQAGVIVPLALTHQMLGRLVGARRPTVSLALKALAEPRLLTRRGDGAWVLAHDAFAHLPADPRAVPARAGDAVSVPLLPDPGRAERPITLADLQQLTERCATLMTVNSAIRARSKTTIERAMAIRDDLRERRELPRPA